ncbi:MAG: right-handed parallel beta-helix repeat-containing protein [Deltaproteobacteria bacterium]|nr:right-handed parallel beta-helix repeat-containing protein [Deltaproteobacteria bacterium]
MNRSFFSILCASIFVVSFTQFSCSKDNSGGSVEGETDSTSENGTDSDSTLDSDSSKDSDSQSDSSSNIVCNAGETEACTCKNDSIGVKRCAPDGSAWSDCECTVYGLNLFISNGAADGDGTVESPYGSIADARDAVRSIKESEGLPENGIAIWLREGTYSLGETVELGTEDGGASAKPVAWRGYPGESVIISGGVNLKPGDFSKVSTDSPVWNRFDLNARDNIVQIDLKSKGITDFGSLTRRGFCGESSSSPVELMFNDESMTLARWPDVDEGIDDVSATADTIEIYGTVTPDVTGTYNRIGENDGASVFKKKDLVGGDQFYLYRRYWEYDGSFHRAWFLTTDESGYPTNNGAWWSLYNSELAPMNPSNGATGNPAFIADDAVRHGLAYIASEVSDTEWTYGGDRPERWKDATDVWFHGWWKHAWADCQVSSASIDTDTKTVTLGDDTGYGIGAGQPYYALNLLEEITVPGEYYIDRDFGILYFYPPAAMNDATITLSMLNEYLFDLNNTSYLEVRDIIFEAGRTQLIRINGGNNNLLAGVTLRNNGGRGVSISGTENGIENCLIYSTATGGVNISGGDRKSLTEAGNFVKNCSIHNFGRIEWTYRPGISLSGVGSIAQNNLIYNAPHSAILYGGNEHKILKNEIHNVCEYSSDAGAIYSGRDWGARGNLIENNFIHHIYSNLEGYGVHGIYLDDCLSGISVFGNILYKIENHALMHGGGRDNLFENNIMVQCKDAIAADSRGFDWRPDGGPNNKPGDSWNLLEKLQTSGYQDEPWLSRYPECAAIPNDWDLIIADGATWTYPEGCTFNKNLGFQNESWMNGGASFDHYKSISDNVENADPLFADEANLDMTLSKDSPALAIPGFKNIPFNEIGILNQ